MTVSPALLNELISEISSLASVYHKPAETFIGAGRVGTELLKKADAEDNRRMTQKALQTVAAGQRIENLLDFDDHVNQTTDQMSSLNMSHQAMQPRSPLARTNTGTSDVDVFVDAEEK